MHHACLLIRSHAPCISPHLLSPTQAHVLSNKCIHNHTKTTTHHKPPPQPLTTPYDHPPPPQPSTTLTTTPPPLHHSNIPHPPPTSHVGLLQGDAAQHTRPAVVMPTGLQGLLGNPHSCPSQQPQQTPL